ncbi:ATP-binding protein [Candidatus Saccharibacteria bacterium]|nr:ATP-binding protein [Candidatus Saccharibacteria bacterium]
MRLLSFSVANYRSFFNEQTIIFGVDGNNVDAVFGANGSGKTNLFLALTFYRNFIRMSTSYEGQTMAHDKFLLNNSAGSKLTSFSAEMQTEKYVYKYSFSIGGKDIEDEYLQRKTILKSSSYSTVFRRNSMDKGRFNEYGFTNELLKSTRQDALILTRAWESNNKIAQEVFEWLSFFNPMSGGQPIGETAQKIIEDEGFKVKVLDLLRQADLSIQDVTASPIKMPDDLYGDVALKNEFKAMLSKFSYDVTTTHLVHDESGKVIGAKSLSMARQESTGTKRIFELAYPLIDALENGKILYIDEFETALHPQECLFIVRLFSGEQNTANAQLIINTHNTKILDKVGRKGVHLVGKNSREESILGVIGSDVRPDDVALEKKYDKGLFGATPNIQW